MGIRITTLAGQKGCMEVQLGINFFFQEGEVKKREEEETEEKNSSLLSPLLLSSGVNTGYIITFQVFLPIFFFPKQELSNGQNAMFTFNSDLQSPHLIQFCKCLDLKVK